MITRSLIKVLHEYNIYMCVCIILNFYYTTDYYTILHKLRKMLQYNHLCMLLYCLLRFFFTVLLHFISMKKY